MEDRFRNKYRTKSLRLEGFDYSSEAIYFITICTKNKIHFWGSVEDDEMILSESGSIVASEWKKTNDIRSRVILGERVVMPNHFHALLYLKPKNKSCRDGSNPSKAENGIIIEKSKAISHFKNKFGPQRDNVSSIVRGFKSACTRRIREKSIANFAWQRGFYDHIVRSQKALQKNEEYIRENPQRWIDDKYYNQ